MEENCGPKEKSNGLVLQSSSPPRPHSLLSSSPPLVADGDAPPSSPLKALKKLPFPHFEDFSAAAFEDFPPKFDTLLSPEFATKSKHFRSLTNPAMGAVHQLHNKVCSLVIGSCS